MPPNRVPRSFFLTALLYLFVPTAVVLIVFGPWPFPAAIVSGLFVYWVMRIEKPPKISSSSLLSTWPYLILAAGAVWLSGILPPFAENSDWHKHYALFNLMASHSWPPVVAMDDGIATLRYSLSYYVFPALAAKCLGILALPASIFTWTVLGVYLVLVLAFGRGSSPGIALIQGCIFLLFSGADIIGTYLSRNVWVLPSPEFPPFHIEWWSTFGVYASSITNLFWAPQHAIAGWISVFLVLRYPLQSVQTAGIIIATLSVWSPFCAVGIFPSLLWATIKTGYRELFTRANLIAAPILLLCAAMFLSKESAGIPRSFIWDQAHISISVWFAFIVLEFGAIALILAIINSQKRLLIAVHAAFLLVISLFSVGSANDLLMRASIPSLGLLAALSATSIVFAKNGIWKGLLGVCLIAGLATPFGEIARSFVAQRILHHESFSIQRILNGESRGYAPQYLVYEKDIDGRFTIQKVMDLTDLNFSQFGIADFKEEMRIESAGFTDAALVSNEVTLPKGLYRLDAVLDWDVTPQKDGKNAGHISFHGKEILIPIMCSKACNEHLTRYFESAGEPFRLCFGLGGWSTGKGFIALKQLEISSIKAR